MNASLCRLACCAIICVAIIVGASAQNSKPMSANYRNHLSEFNDLAIAARSETPGSLRTMTDRIFSGFMSVEVPAEHSLRDRLFRAESKFRAGHHSTVSEDNAVTAFNEIVEALSGPEWAHTNKTQLHLFRLALKPNLPQLIGRQHALRPRDISDQMSPSEAVLVALYLGQGKLTTPDYQVPPDEWVARIRAARRPNPNASRGNSPMIGRLSFQTAGSQLGSFRRSLEAGLRAEESDVSQQAHLFFDRLGISR